MSLDETILRVLRIIGPDRLHAIVHGSEEGFVWYGIVCAKTVVFGVAQGDMISLGHVYYIPYIRIIKV